MAILKSRGDGNKRQRNCFKAPLPNGDESRRRNSLFGSYPDLDTVLWLKQLALDPCKQGASRKENKKSCDRILNVRKLMLMTNSDSPRRKRKLQQFLKSNVATASRLATKKYKQQICSKLSRVHLSVASPDSYSLNLADSGGSFNRKVVQNSCNSGSLLTSEDTVGTVGGKQLANNLSFLDNAIDFVAPTIKYSSPFIDSDESVNGYPLTPENLNLQCPPLVDVDDSAHSSYSSSLKEPEQLHLRRVPIPIGPRFQADVPDWAEPVNKGKLNVVKCDSENLMWLGTRVWPVGGESSELSLKEIGKGRPDSCSCISPGSSDCIKYHILEKRRLHLQSEIGPAFLSWKFDEMGEVVSNSWTWKEQQTFSLLRLKQLKDEANFWEQASKCFPSKCKKSILSYYFNVFIPRRLSVLTKLSIKQVDSDDEEVENDDHTDSQERCKARSDSSRNSKDVKTRYLRQVY